MQPSSSRADFAFACYMPPGGRCSGTCEGGSGNDRVKSADMQTPSSEIWPDRRCGVPTRRRGCGRVEMAAAGYCSRLRTTGSGSRPECASARTSRPAPPLAPLAPPSFNDSVAGAAKLSRKSMAFVMCYTRACARETPRAAATQWSATSRSEPVTSCTCPLCDSSSSTTTLLCAGCWQQ